MLMINDGGHCLANIRCHSFENVTSANQQRWGANLSVSLIGLSLVFDWSFIGLTPQKEQPCEPDFEPPQSPQSTFFAN
jgi:hypothetical protein